MKQETATVLFVVLAVTIILLSLTVGFHLVTKDSVDVFEENRQLCYDLDRCDVYGCLADHALWRKEKTNYLLQEQNCLLGRDALESETESKSKSNKEVK